ncbi:MAG: hypothetical protein AB7T06_06155 [Kofleriaceae bacterium]
MTRIAFLAVSLSVALLGCRGGDDSGDDQPGMDGSGSNASEVTIQEVQNDAMAPGTAIELRGVVVVAIDTYGSRTGELFVAEPEGGPFSGVKVYGASLSDVAMLQVGDLIDITGAEKHEACTEAAPCGTVVFENGAGLTEVQGDTQGSLVITKRGTGTVPTPSVVDAKAISEMPEAERLAEWEKWEGVLITVQNARQLGAYAAFDDGDDQKQFTATSNIKIQSSLADLGAPVVGTCYESITGMGDFFFDYLVLPRSSADLVGGGTGCSVLTTSTIADVQAGTATGAVQINDVYVVAVGNRNGSTSMKRQVWVSHSLTAAPNEGLYIRTSTDPEVDVVPGAKVNVFGTAVEFNNNDMGGGMTGSTLTQLTSGTVTVTAAPTAQVTPVTGQTVASLLADATGEPYESVLVTLTNVKVTTVAPSPMSPSFGVSDLAQYPGNDAFKADDDMVIIPTADMDKCYASITGIWTYQVFENRYQFLPIALGTGTGTCN